MFYLQPADCRALIEKLKNATEDTLYKELQDVKSWSYGKVRKILQFLMAWKIIKWNIESET